MTVFPLAAMKQKMQLNPFACSLSFRNKGPYMLLKEVDNYTLFMTKTAEDPTLRGTGKSACPIT